MFADEFVWSGTPEILLPMDSSMSAMGAFKLDAARRKVGSFQGV